MGLKFVGGGLAGGVATMSGRHVSARRFLLRYFVRVFLVLAVFGLAAMAPAKAAPEGKISGSYSFSEKGCFGKQKNKDCKVSIEIVGAAAKAIYENMQSKPDAQGCLPNEKIDTSGLWCSKGDNEDYTCNFGYHFKTQRMTHSDTDC